MKNKKQNELRFIYPACVYPNDEGGYTAIFPDLKGCVTEGNTPSELLFMLNDAGCGWILGELEDGNPLPEPSDYKSIEADEYENGVVTLVPLDVGTYAEKYSQKAVRKNCTIPSWLDTFASKNQLSLSEILQNALIGIYKQTNHLD